MPSDEFSAGCSKQERPALFFSRDMHGTARVWLPVCLGLAGVLALGSCATDRKRDPGTDKRKFEAVDLVQPQVSADADAAARTAPYRLQIWQRDLDATDNRAFARAVSGLRSNLPAYVSLLSAARLPESPRGRQAVAELIREGLDSGLVKTDPWPEVLADVVATLARPAGEGPLVTVTPTGEALDVPKVREARLLASFADPMEKETQGAGAKGGESQASVAARLAAMELARELPADARAELMHWRLFDPSREIRFAAAESFRNDPRSLTKEHLENLLKAVRNGHRELRADCALLLTHLERRLEVRIPGGNLTGLTLDAHAPEPVRLKQLAVWETWLANVDPALARLKAVAERDGDDAGD